MRALHTMAAVVLTAAAITITTGTGAQAAVTGYHADSSLVGGGPTVNVRSSASMSAPVVRTLTNGAPISISCQTVGSPLGFGSKSGNRTWDVLVDGNAMHDIVTSTPGGGPRTTYSDGTYTAFSPGIPRCGTAATRETKAVEWARSELGDRTQSGWCERFVEQSFGTTSRYGSALAAYTAQRAAGRIHTDAAPPAGSLVYYAYGDFGHVSVSEGNGWTVSTFGGVGANRPVAEVRVLDRGLPYLGWAWAPDSWSGR